MIFSSTPELHNWLTKLALHGIPLPKIAAVSTQFIREVREGIRYYDTSSSRLDGVLEFHYMGSTLWLIEIEE